MIGKLDHLQSLGINCLELLPVQEFNEMEYYQACLRFLLLLQAVGGSSHGVTLFRH